MSQINPIAVVAALLLPPAHSAPITTNTSVSGTIAANTCRSWSTHADLGTIRYPITGITGIVAYLPPTKILDRCPPYTKVVFGVEKVMGYPAARICSSPFGSNTTCLLHPPTGTWHAKGFELTADALGDVVMTNFKYSNQPYPITTTQPGNYTSYFDFTIEYP